MSVRTFASAAITALAVATVLVLTSCGDNHPAPEPSATTTTTAATPDPGPTPPPLPPEATQDSREGAIAFVKHYIDLLNYAQATGDVAELRAATRRECADCLRLINDLSQLYSAGGSIEGGELIPGEVDALENQAEHGWSILVRVTSGQQTVYDAPAAEPREFAGGTRPMDFFPTFIDGTWKMKRWSRV